VSRVLARLMSATIAVVALMSTAAVAAPALPHYDHVFMTVEENHGFQDIIGNPAAPTINALANAYGLATQYYGVTHPSGPNYVAMLGGGTFGVGSDDPYWVFGVDQPSLISQLDAAHLSWRGYFQGMPYPGYRGYCYPVRCLGVPDSDTLYIAKHNGLPYFHSVNSSASELAKMRPLADLHRDLRRGHVPRFSYVIPDECTDMHGAPPVCIDSGDPGDVDDNQLVSTADAFLAKTVYEISHAAVWRHGNNAIVITFDEGDDDAGCCGTDPGGGRALTIVITNHGPRGLSDPTPYNHYSLLSTFERVFGLPCLAGACDTANIKPMAPLFAADPSTKASPVPERLLEARRGVGQIGPEGPTPPVQAGADGPLPGDPTGAGAPGQWQAVPSPNLSSDDNNLASVCASSRDDAWAVGNYYTDQNGNVFRNLAEHWDGVRWTAIAPPNLGDQENTLFSVTCTPDGHAWAVGYYADQSFRIRTLAEHWDGSRWSVVPTVDPRRGRDIFFSVKALGDHDVFAVGGSQDSLDGAFHTLIEHWDGSRWTVVHSPDPGPNGNELFAVTARSPTDAWAVGQQQGGGFPSLALAEHWDGHSWRIASVPGSRSRSFDPYAAAALGRRLLATGDQEDDVTPQTTLSFTAGRDAAGVIPSANAGSGENDFYGVDAADGLAWAAGRSNDPSTDLTSTLIERLGPGGFSPVPSPNPGGDGGSAGLGGVAIAPGGESWAVGAFTTATSANRTLIERYVPAGH
jgi:Phosphoesterase family